MKEKNEQTREREKDSKRTKSNGVKNGKRKQVKRVDNEYYSLPVSLLSSLRNILEKKESEREKEREEDAERKKMKKEEEIKMKLCFIFFHQKKIQKIEKTMFSSLPL